MENHIDEIVVKVYVFFLKSTQILFDNDMPYLFQINCDESMPNMLMKYFLNLHWYSNTDLLIIHFGFH